MVRIVVKTTCPRCGTRYSGPNDETHKAGCPWPSEKRLRALQDLLIVNTCPLCGSDVHVNGGDLHECVACHTQWVNASRAMTPAVKIAEVIFHVRGEPVLVSQLPIKGTGNFPLREVIAILSREVTLAKASFRR